MISGVSLTYIEPLRVHVRFRSSKTAFHAVFVPLSTLLQYRQDQYLHTHHVIHAAALDGFLRFHAFCHGIAEFFGFKAGSLRQIFSGGEGGDSDPGGDGTLVVSFGL